MRDIAIHRIRIVLSGRPLSRAAARELGAAFAAALPQTIAAAAARAATANVDAASVTVNVPAQTTPRAMAAAVGRAIGHRVNAPNRSTGR